MPKITENGRELASKLNPAIGTTREILETCSLIARHAKTYDRLAVEACNGPWFVSLPNNHIPQERYSKMLDKWQTDLERRDEACAARIRKLVESLPLVDGQPIKPILGGDPRGCVVMLALPGEWSRLHDDWGRAGICVL